MYEYHNNILSIPAKLLYKDWALMAYHTYKSWCQRGKLVRTKEGRGKGNEAFVSYYDLPKKIKDYCIKMLGDPEKVVSNNLLEKYIELDVAAAKYYAAHRTPSGKPLSLEKQREKSANVDILNALKRIIEENSPKIFKNKAKKIWTNFSDAVNDLDTNRWPHSLPGNKRSLQRRYKKYIIEGYDTYIHKNEGAANAIKIKGDIADFLLAQYCLPIKLTIPEVLEKYDYKLETENWPTLTNGAVYNFLFRPENERIWTLARHGIEAYNRKYKHTLTRDRSEWFPNSFWAIDGTKLDWIHFWEDSSNKMGAKLKINVMFDVYSEKIIGWALAFTESHVEHFKAIKMAVSESNCRPYYLTYDNQSGHKMKRMQDLYSSLVAKDGGIHHANKVKQHNNPAEQLFKRIQQQVINKFWFSDGQSITVKRDDNKMNSDFIMENKALLKTVEELYAAWEAVVNIWNNKKHPHINETRNQVYQHKMPMREELSMYDIMTKMWVEQKKKPIKYKAHGLDFRLQGKKYQFEVYDANGNVDLEFRRLSVGKKFIVRYDPDFLDGYIQLCDKDANGNVIHIANAEPKRKHQNIPTLMNEGDKEKWFKDFEIREKEFDRDLEAYNRLMNRTGITPQQEIDNQDLLIKFKGDLTKVQRSNAETEENLTNAALRL